MRNPKTLLNAIIAVFLLFAATNLTLAYYAGSQPQPAHHQMSYADAVKATEKDCCK